MIKRKVGLFIEVDNKAKAKVIGGEDHIIKDKEGPCIYWTKKQRPLFFMCQI
jgi:hypothetical protein